jgi:hypothetical protein
MNTIDIRVKKMANPPIEVCIPIFSAKTPARKVPKPERLDATIRKLCIRAR